ncbi:MAG TPA: MOSC domain-containing protein [Pyrinomonadaceae bacterium]
MNNQPNIWAQYQVAKNIVDSVFRRPHRDAVPEKSEKLFLRAGIGIYGDCHAKPTSPRQVLLVSTGAYRQFKLAPCSLRENILIDVDELRLSSGDLLLIGDRAALRITFECEPCARLNRFRPKLSRDIKGNRGYVARVIRSGMISPKNKIEVIPRVFRSFSYDWKERVIDIVRMLPPDHVISYVRLAELAGVPKSFCRSFPRLLHSREDVPWARVVPSHEMTEANVHRFANIQQLGSSGEMSKAVCRPAWLGSEVFSDEIQFMSKSPVLPRKSS